MTEAAGVVRGVILDVDGTLLDSNDAHAASWVDAFGESSYDVPFDIVRPMIGMGGDKLLPAAVGVESDSDEGRRLSERKKEIFTSQYLPELEPFPRVRDLLERMRGDGLQLSVASSAKDEELKALLQAAGVSDLMADTTSSSDASRSKPDPDIVSAAVRASGIAAAVLVMLGDTPYDVEAASGAGVRCVAVRCGGWGDEALRGAIEIYDDPAAILAAYDSSIFGRSARR